MTGAPLYQALAQLAARQGLRFHMPGHKGRGLGSLFDPVLAIDYTEIPPTGNLYGEGGPIQAAEALAADYWGMDRCFFLTCGASQGIKAALLAFCGQGGAVVLDRNCHQSALDACALLDLRPSYVWPRHHPATGLTDDIAPSALAAAIRACGAKAALVTSPTYYGRLLDIAALARAARAAGAALLVDAAHGSHLRACGLADPAAQGADGVIFSAHKTLTALGQGAFLLARGQSEPFCAALRRATALFGTTSPSYPIMASLDLARLRLEDGAAQWRRTAERCLEAGRAAAEGLAFLSPAPGADPCRLTVSTAGRGLSGFEAARHLRRRGIEPEMADARHLVMIATPADRPEDFAALSAALAALPAGRPLPAPAAPPPRPRALLTPRQALFSPGIPVPLGACAGRVAAQYIAPYPPGVPVIAPGEVIDEVSVEYLLENGYNEVDSILIVNS